MGRMMRRGFRGQYIPNTFPVGNAGAPALPTPMPPGAPTSVGAQATQQSLAQSSPFSPVNPPTDVIFQHPQEFLRRGPLGRRMSHEEALGQWIWKRHACIDGDNHLFRCAAKRPLFVKRYPWLDMPPGGEPFFYENGNEVDLPAQNTSVVVASFQVPQRKNGAIEFLANQFLGGGLVEGTGSFIWQLLADGVPIKGFNRIISTIGTTANMADFRESPIRIFENQLIQLILNNVSVVPSGQPLQGIIRGKFWPMEQEGGNTWA